MQLQLCGLWVPLYSDPQSAGLWEGQDDTQDIAVSVPDRNPGLYLQTCAQSPWH